MRWSRDGAQAMLALRARFGSLDLDAPLHNPD